MLHDSIEKPEGWNFHVHVHVPNAFVQDSHHFCHQSKFSKDLVKLHDVFWHFSEILLSITQITLIPSLAHVIP